jgi:uroporphyrinogen-III synthase
MANGHTRFPHPQSGEGNESPRELHGNQPLAGLNIVVTRPREQAASLAQRITTLGGNAILFPLLEIAPVSDPRPLQELVSRLADFDLAIFISPNAVRYGTASIQMLPATLRVATVGQSSAQALRDAGANEVLAPEGRSDSEALLALPQLQNVRGWKTVIFRGDGGRELLGDTLKLRGATVEYITCYQRSKPLQEIGTLLTQKPDAITVSSSEALGYLWDMFDEASRNQISAIPLFVPHARIAEKAQQQGWQKIIQTAGGDDGIISSLVACSKATI